MKLRFLHRALKARYRDQKCEIRALLEALSPSDIAVDVGANKGSYLIWLSKAVPSGHVVAFEPQPSLANYLKKAVATFGLSNVTVESAGVSDHSGALILHIPGEGDSPGASFEEAVRNRETCRDIEVPIYTLDGYFSSLPGRIGAIKVDVEGHELAVFRGAERIIRESRPLVVFECESRHMSRGSVQDVLEFFLERDYEGWFIRRGELRPLAEFDPDIHQSQVGEKFWDSKDYCNNFVVRPHK